MTVPLNPDPLFWFSLAAPSPWFTGISGMLNAQGSATMQVLIPAVPSLVGTRIYGAFAIAAPLPPGFTVSSSLPITIQ
jgi:hypothetical protein